MIALRATHQAFKVACDVGYEPIDTMRLPCNSCGEKLDWRNNTFDDSVRCTHCGGQTELPPYFRAHLLPRPIVTCPPSLEYLPKMSAEFCPATGPAPRWLIALGAASLTVVVAGLAYTFVYLRSP